MRTIPDALPLALPPSPLVRTVAGWLDIERRPKTVLDIGCLVGRNSIYLASRGHHVLGIDNDYESIYQATALREMQELPYCDFVVGDARHLPVRKTFQVVLANEVLHMMPKSQSRGVLKRIQSLTESGGINVISGYVVRPGTANELHTRNMFAPDELRSTYENAGWRILDHNETYLPNTLFNNQERINSTTHIIAQRPW